MPRHPQPDLSWPASVFDPQTDADAVQNLRHTLALFDDNEDDRLVLMATSNIYGDGVRTGLTMRDLRLLLARLDRGDQR